ncbi:MAG: zeta toxin family protein [Pseudomonadota bacterium]
MTLVPYLIAISGGSGSGKSTLADALIDRLDGGAVLFHEDAYYWPIAHYSDADLAAGVNFDAPASKDINHLVRDIAALKVGQTVQQPIYDYTVHDRVDGSTRSIAPAPVMIVEGIHVLSIPEADQFIDLRVYVDTPDDLRLARRIRRDVIERGRDVESVLSQYMATVRPAHYAYTYPAKFGADLVIADEGLPAFGDVRPSDMALERMLAPVMDRLRSAGYI